MKRATIHLPERFDEIARRGARRAGERLVERSPAPRRRPASFVALLDRGGAAIVEPEDPPPGSG